MAEVLATRLGDHLKKLRERRKLSQTLLADHAGVDRSYISLIENGHNDVTVAMLNKLCEVLQVTLAEFFSEANLG